MSFEYVEKVVQVRDQNSANEQLAAGWSLLAIVPGFDNGCAYTNFVLGKPASMRTELTQAESTYPVIMASVTYVTCPICAAEQDGFVNDPRGGNYVCEECNKPYHIPTDARISFN